MSDYISREKAINALGEQPLNWDDSEVSIAERAMWEEHKTAIENIPSENVKPVVYGKRVEQKYTTISITKSRKINNKKNYCSICGKSNGRRKDNFCPHCGADMRGEQK